MNDPESGRQSLSADANPVLRIDELPDADIRDKPDIKIVF
jgi:hypothetical protein